MGIGVDLTCLANDRGYGRFTGEIVPAMIAMAPDDTFVCFADELAAQRFHVRRDNVELIRVPQSQAPTVAAAATDYRSPADMWRLTRAVWRARIDVFFSPTERRSCLLFPHVLRHRLLRAVLRLELADVFLERLPLSLSPTMMLASPITGPKCPHAQNSSPPPSALSSASSKPPSANRRRNSSKYCGVRSRVSG